MMGRNIPDWHRHAIPKWNKRCGMAKKVSAKEFAYRENRDFGEDRRDWIRLVIGNQEIEPRHKLVGVAVALRMNHRTEESYPKTATIALDVGVSVRTVIRALKILEGKGLLKITRRKRGVNRYEMILPWK